MYAHFYRNVIFPLYEVVLRRRNTLSFLSTLDASQWQSVEQLRQLQLSKIRKLVQYAYLNVPFYAKTLDAAGVRPGDIRSLQDIRRIPVLTKNDIRENFDLLTAKDADPRKIFQSASGGSTGEPLRIRLDHDNYEWRQAAVKRAYSWSGYRDGERTLFIWGVGAQKPSFFNRVKHDIDVVLKNHTYFNSFSFSDSNLQMFADKFNSLKPKFVIAYTMPLFNLAQFMKSKKIIPFRPKAIIAAAEKVYPHQRELIQEVFGCPVFETYGCREVTSIAAECELHDGMHVNMENIYLEIEKDGAPMKPGDSGEVIITDLNNYCFPLIRYRNEDLAVRSSRTCKCGRGLELLDRVEGRILDVIKTRDGRYVPGEYFVHLFKDYPDIKQFQVVQESIDSVNINLVLSKPLSNDQFDYIKDHIEKTLGNSIALVFNIVDSIPLTASGKFRVTISKVDLNVKLSA